jgi:hypothetical protein
MKCSDTMKKLKYIFNFLRDLCSLSHIYIYIYIYSKFVTKDLSF